MLPQHHKAETTQTATVILARLGTPDFTPAQKATMATFFVFAVLTIAAQVAGFALPRPQIGVPAAGAAADTTVGAGGTWRSQVLNHSSPLTHHSCDGRWCWHPSCRCRSTFDSSFGWQQRKIFDNNSGILRGELEE